MRRIGNVPEAGKNISEIALRTKFLKSDPNGPIQNKLKQQEIESCVQFKYQLYTIQRKQRTVMVQEESR